MKIELTKEEVEWVKNEIFNNLESVWCVDHKEFDRENPDFNLDNYLFGISVGEAVKELKILESILEKLK